MSRKSGQQDISSNADSFGPSSVSSCGSEKNLYQKKFEKEQERASKLEEKIEGYKTVVQQLPRCQKTIAHLKKKELDSAHEIEQLKKAKAEQDKKVAELQKLLRQQEIEGEGFTELTAVESRRSTISNTGHSPSFEIIGKSSNLNSAGTRTPSQRASTPVDAQSSRSDPRMTGSQHRIQKVVQQERTGQQTFTTQSQDGYPQHDPRPVRDIPSVARSAETHHREFVRGASAPAASSCDKIRVSNPPGGARQHSFPIVSGGPVKVLAIGTCRPAWQIMEQEVSKNSQAAAAASSSRMTTPAHAAPARENDNFVLPPPSQVTSAEPFDFEMVQTNGGARPKEWKPLNTMTTSAPIYNDMSSSQVWRQTSENTPETSDFDPFSPVKTAVARRSQNNLNADVRTFSNMQPLVDVPNAGDLMKFPSLNNGTPSPQTQKNIVAYPEQPLYSRQNGSVAMPSDEQSHLAVQAESMAALLKGNSSSEGMSDMLFKFAEQAKQMEAKLNDCQAMIQRQQVQIQSYSKFGKNEELERLRDEVETLREENATLLAFITTQKEGLELEPGWVSVINNQTSTDPVRAHYPDSPIMKKVEQLEKINARLFLANKDWHNKWEVLRQQHQAEREELESHIQSLTTDIEKSREEIATLDKQLQEANSSKQECMKRKFSLEEEKLHLQRQIEGFKSENSDLSRSLRRMESEMKSLKGSSRSKDRGQVCNKDLETEIGLLKQQLTIFADDFEKERQDRASAESKVEKARMERDQMKHSMESKLKKINVQLRTQEDELRMKARQCAELQYQVDDLKLKLKREQRHATLAAQHSYSYQPPLSTIQPPTRSPAYPSGGAKYQSQPGYPSQNNQPSISNNYPQPSTWTGQVSPEHLPGAWQCRHCTYINYPNRTVCDICGYQNSNGDSEPASGRQELQSRGDEQARGMDVADVVVDSL